jgi:hypothetical protein
MRQSTNRRGVAEPQVWFRIVHVAADGHHRALGAAYGEQTVEITLGSRGAFKNGNVGAVSRKVASDWVVSALPEPRGGAKPPKEPRTPRVVELLRQAHDWQALLESGEVRNQAAIARREGITRARVTQIMVLLRLAPEIQKRIPALPETVARPVVTERALRHMAQIESHDKQLVAFRDLLTHTGQSDFRARRHRSPRTTSEGRQPWKP